MPAHSPLSPIARAAPTDVARDAAVLRGLLERGLRPLEARAVDLGDASEHVRAFWAEVGWSPLYASRLEPPETAHAVATAPKLMAAYAREKRFRLRMRDLPTSYRLVHVDSQGLGFSLTDESSGADPSTLVLSEQKGTITRGPASYLASCSAYLLAIAFRRYYETEFEAKPSLDIGGRPLLPLLAPEARELADGVWLVASADKKGRVRHSVRHVTTEALIAWLRTLPAGTAAVMNLGRAGANVRVNAASRKRLTSVHPLENPAGDFLYEVGSLDNVPVIYWRDPEKSTPHILVSHRRSRRFAPPAKARAKAGPRPELYSVFDTPGLRAPPKPVRHSEATMRKAIEALAGLIDPLPLHNANRRPVALESNAPRDLRLFWERIGWSDLLRRVCVCPERTVGEEEARALLGRWMEDASTRDRYELLDGADPTMLPVFPERWRLFQYHRPRKAHDYLMHDSYLVVADESEGAHDPPLFEIMPGQPEPTYLPKRYVAHLARQLFDEAFDKAAGPAAPPKDAPRAFEPLIDDVWLVAPGVLCRRSKAAGPRGSGFGVCFGSLRSYYDYARTLPDKVLAQGAPSGGDAVTHKVLAKANLTPDRAAKLGMRVSPVHSEGRGVQIALGLVEGAPVWLEWLLFNDRVFGRSLVTTASDLERVKRALNT
jgi:hypothetical protein